MLVLTRKLQEKITIAGNITVTVLRVKGQTVRIGIEAPREIRVVRGELPLEVAKEMPESPVQSDSSSAESEDTDLESLSGAKEASNETSRKTRLPQRRKFDRYSQAPLKGVVGAVALAK